MPAASLSASFMASLLLYCTGNVKDRAQVDILGLHLQIPLPFNPRFAMLDDLDTNVTISPIDTFSVVATQ